MWWTTLHRSGSHTFPFKLQSCALSEEYWACEKNCLSITNAPFVHLVKVLCNIQCNDIWQHCEYTRM